MLLIKRNPVVVIRLPLCNQAIFLNNGDQATVWSAELKRVEHHPIDGEYNFHLIPARHLCGLPKIDRFVNVQLHVEFTHIKGKMNVKV